MAKNNLATLLIEPINQAKYRIHFLSGHLFVMHSSTWRYICRAVIVVALLFTGFSLRAAEHNQLASDPALVMQAYLRATYARDFAESYRYISGADKKVRDLNRYLKQRGPFAGFTLEVARKLSESIEIKPEKRQDIAGRVFLTVKYKVPDPKSLAPMLLDWDVHRLNALAPAEREKILRAIERMKRDGSMNMSAGDETFQLVSEQQQWRVHLDWAAGVKIPLRVDSTRVADLDVSLSESQIMTQPGELFEIFLKIKNRAERPIVARIGHRVDPDSLADYLEFVQCGFLLPVSVAPAEEREFSGTYLLRGSLPEGVRQINLTYDFRLLE